MTASSAKSHRKKGIRVKIGDVFEVSTGKGLAYGQITHRHPKWGWLVRILPGLFKERPESFRDLVQSPTKFVIFFPVSVAVSFGEAQIVGREPVPLADQKFPLFRDTNALTTTGDAVMWWFWDGEDEWRVGRLLPEQRKMPLLQLINAALLIERIESDWTPEKDPR